MKREENFGIYRTVTRYNDKNNKPYKVKTVNVFDIYNHIDREKQIEEMKKNHENFVKMMGQYKNKDNDYEITVGDMKVVISNNVSISNLNKKESEYFNRQYLPRKVSIAQKIFESKCSFMEASKMVAKDMTSRDNLYYGKSLFSQSITKYASEKTKKDERYKPVYYNVSIKEHIEGVYSFNINNWAFEFDKNEYLKMTEKGFLGLKDFIDTEKDYITFNDETKLMSVSPDFIIKKSDLRKFIKDFELHLKKEQNKETSIVMEM